MRAKPYSSGAATLVFVYSITGAVAPSYEVDRKMWKMDPMPKLPTLLYIGRRGRVIERAIRIIDFVPSLPNYRLDMPALVCLDLYIGQPRLPLRATP